MCACRFPSSWVWIFWWKIPPGHGPILLQIWNTLGGRSNTCCWSLWECSQWRDGKKQRLNPHCLDCLRCIPSQECSRITTNCTFNQTNEVGTSFGFHGKFWTPFWDNCFLPKPVQRFEDVSGMTCKISKKSSGTDMSLSPSLASKGECSQLQLSSMDWHGLRRWLGRPCNVRIAPGWSGESTPTNIHKVLGGCSDTTQARLKSSMHVLWLINQEFTWFQERNQNQYLPILTLVRVCRIWSTLSTLDSRPAQRVWTQLFSGAISTGACALCH